MIGRMFFLLAILVSVPAFTAHYLEKGEILKSFENFLEGKPAKDDLYLIKSLAEELKEEIKIDVPSYIKFYSKGILQEKRGNMEEALKNYLKSIELNPNYNPSYFRFNYLIRQIKNPNPYREEIKKILIKRFEKPPKVIIENAKDKYLFLVEKMSQYLFIYRGKELVEIHPVTTGMDWEDKWIEGDKRTPEGIYYFTEFIPPHRLAKMYGGIAVVMNYPNPVDKLLNKGGSGIWLHGSDSRNRNKIPFSTRGCVVGENTSLKEIVKKIRIHNTLISVYKYIPESKPKTDVIGFLKSWKESWERKDVNAFLSHYSKKFRWKRGGYKEWKDYKRRVISQKKRITVSISNLTVVGFWKEGGKIPEYYVAEFYQTYSSDSYSDKGFKRLYIWKEGGKLKIISEEFYREGRK